MTDPAVILQGQLASLDLDESQPVIYDRPIGLRLLYQDPASGAEHYVIRYPPGLKPSVTDTVRRTRSSCSTE